MPARVPREVVAAERRLPALAARLEIPLARLRGEEQVVALGLGLRGWSLYRGFRHALSGPSPPTAAHVDLRALLDVMILARWIEADPPLRVRLWFADDQRERLLGTELVEEWMRRRGQTPPGRSADFDQSAIEDEIRTARADAFGAGIKLPRSGRRCLPTLDDMVKTVPDLWEAYHIGYRHLRPMQHAAGRSFVRDRTERRADGQRYLKPGTPFDLASLRALSVPTICTLLASVSRQAGLGIEAECDAVRMSVIVPPAP
jgi:hypothetical protein